jgi:4-hydroxybenzoate polyprenyltransferase
MLTKKEEKSDNRLSPREIMQLIRLPNLVIILVTQYFTAIFLIGMDDPFSLYLFDPNLFLLSASTVLIAAGGYIINDYYDIKIDYINRPDKVLVGKLIKRRIALTTHIVFSFFGVLIGLYINLIIGGINLIAAFLLWFYSNQLKRLPLVGNVTIAFLTSLGLLVVVLLYPKNQLIVIIYAMFAFFINLIREIIKDIEDWKGDQAFGCKTLPVVLGIRKTKRIVLFILLIFIGSVVWLTLKQDNYFLKIYFVFLAIPAVIFIQRLIRADSKRNFYLLSGFCKLIMLSGIISMIFFKLIK